MKAFIIFIMFFICLVPGFADAATYYMRSDGTAGSKATATSCGAITTAMNVATHNGETFSAGDIIKLCDTGGNYASTIVPPSSGSSGSPITYQNETGDTPIIDYDGGSGTVAFDSGGQDYITVDGLIFTGTSIPIRVGFPTGSLAATNWEIKNCTFTGYRSDNALGAIYIRDASNYTYIHDNTFNAGAEATTNATEGDVVNITDSSYCRVANNTFIDGMGHFFLSVRGATTKYNTITDNTFYMSDIYVPGDQYNNIDVFIQVFDDASFTLIENNTMNVHTDVFVTDENIWGIRIESANNNIIRKNTLYDFPSNSFQMNEDNSGSGGTSNNSIYHNTSENTGASANYYGWMRWQIHIDFDGMQDNNIINNISHTDGWNYVRESNNYDSTTYLDDSSFINNILYNTAQQEEDIVSKIGNKTLTQANTDWASWSGNLEQDPLFTDLTNNIYTLQPGSPAIDAGAWLTTITSPTGSGTLFTVADASYFYDGWSIPGEVGDIIKTASGQTATISFINYSTKTISVSPPISWTQGEGIALDYYGSAPDIGAQEAPGDIVIAGVGSTISPGTLVVSVVDTPNFSIIGVAFSSGLGAIAFEAGEGVRDGGNGGARKGGNGGLR